jgi:hypothetical protein
MAPRSLEHKLQITMFRTGHNLAFLSRGILGWFTSRLDCISSFCVVYSFTGILFTVRYCCLCLQLTCAGVIELHEAARRRDLRSNDDDDDDTTSIYLHPLINYSFIHSFIQMKNSQNSQFIYAGSCGDNDKKSTIIHQRH